MIFHINRATVKASATREQIEEVLESWRNQGRSNPAVKSFVVGRDHGGEFEYSAVFVLEDLDALYAYLTHPTTYETDRLGLGLAERLDIFDVTDDDDPEFGAKVQELHRRRNEDNPAILEMLGDIPAFNGAGLN
ncbi:Stress responsive A/B Barrel Domain [Lentzea fradiae]|uniref:Stress responsive A/B Barrel Domain n=1 Tax=Lentzea fradiae TaxID=200378 RepID=A0A1G7MFV5_9PSEU|nr:Dabb family protein [Lentzea fradiae]SDF60718.1 Stress responsive A/B Barrel Domain [Lentzea fradiae]